jgi:hypothetical protein
MTGEATVDEGLGEVLLINLVEILLPNLPSKIIVTVCPGSVSQHQYSIYLYRSYRTMESRTGSCLLSRPRSRVQLFSLCHGSKYLIAGLWVPQ